MKTWKRIPETGIISARLCQSIAVILVKNRAGIKERESDRDKETEKEREMFENNFSSICKNFFNFSGIF